MFCKSWLTTRSLFPSYWSSRFVIVWRSVVGNISWIAWISSFEYDGGGGLGMADGSWRGVLGCSLIGRLEGCADAVAPLVEETFGFTTGVALEFVDDCWLNGRFGWKQKQQIYNSK